MRRLTLALAVGLVAAPQVTAAQERDSVHLRNDCRLAIQAVRTGHPRPHLAWAYQQLRICGAEGAAALAERLSELRKSSDKALWHFVTYPAVRDLRDRRLFEVSLSIAGDPAASETARAYAFRNLIWIVSPSADLETFDPWVTEGLGCLGARTDAVQTEGEPLPPDAESRIRDVALTAYRDRNASNGVRTAALCVLVYGGWHRNLR